MSNLLQPAIAAIKAGDKTTGRRLLAQVLKNDGENATAWVLLSTVVDDPTQKRHCLDEALRINRNQPQATDPSAGINPPEPSAIKTAPLRKPAISRIPTAPLRKPPPLPPDELLAVPLPSNASRLENWDESSYPLPDWMSEITPSTESKPEPLSDTSSADEEETPYELPEWMIPTDPFPITRSVSEPPTAAFASEPEEDAGQLPEWVSSLKSIAMPGPSSDAFIAETGKISYEIPDWMSQYEPSTASSSGPEDALREMSIEKPNLEPFQSPNALFTDENEAASMPPAKQPPQPAIISDEDRVVIPAWLEHMSNPAQKYTAPDQSSESFGERSFWETPLAESSPAAWSKLEAEADTPAENTDPTPLHEYPDWDTPWHEASQAQETARQARLAAQKEAARRLPWHVIWSVVLRESNVESFEIVLSDPGLSVNRAAVWMFWVALIQYTILYGLGSLFDLPMAQQAAPASISPIFILMCAPLPAVLYSLGFLLSAGLLQIGAKIMGGRGSYQKFVFALAAYQAPMQIIYSVLAIFLIMVTNYLPSLAPLLLFISAGIGLGLLIYNLKLMISAYRAVHQFGVWAALGAILMPVLLIAGLAIGAAIWFAS